MVESATSIIEQPNCRTCPTTAGGGHVREDSHELNHVNAQRTIKYIQDRELRPGYHLTAKRLAKEFAVSRSPVRAALIYLADRKRSNPRSPCCPSKTSGDPEQEYCPLMGFKISRAGSA